MSTQVEKWRVNTIEGIFETDLDTLKQWISEGCVLPTDKVSKGSLNWIEAGRAPMLRAAFAGELHAAAPPPVPVPDPVPASTIALDVSHSPSTDLSSQHEFVPPPVAPVTAPVNICYNHAQIASKYLCRSCANAFCDECPKFVGTSKVPLCPLCGDLCTLVQKVQHIAARRELQSSGFGFADLSART